MNREKQNNNKHINSSFISQFFKKIFFRNSKNKEKINISDVIVSKAEMKDVLEIAKLEMFSLNLRREKLWEWRFAIVKQTVYKATINNKIIGAHISTPTFNKTWHTSSLIVHPNYRRSGVGRKILTKTIEDAYLRPMEFEVNTKDSYLIPFYESFGFKIQKKVKNYFNNGATYYIMVLE